MSSINLPDDPGQGLGATHWHAPFAGRSKETGLLGGLLERGLGSDISEIRVAGEPGVGRRRLIRHVAAGTPGAEWVDLAPSQGPPVFTAWVRGELLDFLSAYPDLAVPSWSLQVLSRIEPGIERYIATPAMSREPLAESTFPELVGAAVARVALGLTAYSPVIVHVGLWPRSDSLTGRALQALERQLSRPGCLLVGAASEEPGPDPRHRRTLSIKNLGPAEVNNLAAAWCRDPIGPRFGAWLHRATAGNPLYLSEVVRWLEESGFLHIAGGKVSLLEPIRKLPIPLNLASIQTTRVRGLPLAAQHVLDLVKQNEGRLSAAGLRDAYEGRDHGFEEAYALLRRRCFFYRPSPSYPHALASPLLGGIVTTPSKRKFPRRKLSAPVGNPGTPASPLARAFAGVEALEEAMRHGEPDLRTPLAEALRKSRPRHTRAWEAIHGRLLVLTAWHHVQNKDWGRALRTCSLAGKHLQPDTHPGLLQNILYLKAWALTQLERRAEAQAAREEALNEAQLSGHLVRVPKLRAWAAEGRRRFGELTTALDDAAEAMEELCIMGQSGLPASLTRREAHFDLRRIAEALLDAGVHSEAETLADPVKLSRSRYIDPSPQGWGPDLDEDKLWMKGRAMIGRAASLKHVDKVLSAVRIAQQLEKAGWACLAADFMEVGALLESTSDRFRRQCLNDAVRLNQVLHPSRNRFLARAIQPVPADVTPATRTALQKASLQVVSTAMQGRAETRITLFGTPGIHHQGRTLPLSLMPEWWRHVFADGMSLALSGRPVPAGLLQEARHAAGESAFSDAAAGVAAFNALLDSPGIGGLTLRGDKLHWQWPDGAVDAQQVVALLDADPVDLHQTARWIRGPFLPDHDSAAVTEARARLAFRLEQSLKSNRTPGEAGRGREYLAWMEGPGRIMSCRRELAQGFRIRGRTRTAILLESG